MTREDNLKELLDIEQSFNEFLKCKINNLRNDDTYYIWLKEFRELNK